MRWTERRDAGFLLRAISLTDSDRQTDRRTDRTVLIFDHDALHALEDLHTQVAAAWPIGGTHTGQTAREPARSLLRAGSNFDSPAALTLAVSLTPFT